LFKGFVPAGTTLRREEVPGNNRHDAYLSYKQYRRPSLPGRQYALVHTPGKLSSKFQPPDGGTFIELVLSARSGRSTRLPELLTAHT
jgi:hypothetical protein